MIALIKQTRSAAPGAPRRIIDGMSRLISDESGQATIEWALVLAAVALPMFFIFKVCLDLLVAHFQMVTFMETLPFP